MAVLAQARAEEIEQGLRAVMDPVDYVELRAPETGLVMLRGRIGGDGAAFRGQGPHAEEERLQHRSIEIVGDGGGIECPLDGHAGGHRERHGG